MSALLTALTPVLVHAAADLDDVWVTTHGLRNVPVLALVWAGIALVTAALLTAWHRRDRALQRSLARLRATL